jgi:sortase A
MTAVEELLQERQVVADELIPKRPRRPPRPPKLPRPPKRAPRKAAPIAELGPRSAVARTVLRLLAAVLLGFVINLMILSHLQHAVSQQNLQNSFKAQLSAGTAPVSEGTVDDVLLSDGDPVAMLEIPSIGVHEVVVEGTSSAALKAGPGHRRDTPLPGQAGLSYIMARSAAYGGPFSRLQELQPGETFEVITGQGEQTYKVLGLRYAGDPAPQALKGGQSRLVLETARGSAYIPTGVVRVDAELVSKVEVPGKRQTTYVSLDPADKELASDTNSVWALVFAFQFLILIEVGAAWALVNVGSRRTWVVFVPLTVLAGLLVADQAANLLPNLL